MSRPWSALQSGVLLTATSALARWLTADYDAAQIQAGLSAWEAPAIFSLDAWLARQWDQLMAASVEPLPLLLSPLQTQLLWEEAIAATPASDALLDLGATARAAAAAWELAHAWQLDFASPAWQQSEDSEAFHAWARIVTERCRRQGWLLRAQLSDRIAVAIAAGEGPFQVSGNHFFHAGFDERTPQLQQLWRAIASCGATVVPWPEAAHNPHPTAAAFPDAESEWRSAAHWAAAQLHAGATGPIAIVGTDLANSAAAAERIFNEVLHPGRAPWEASPCLFTLAGGNRLITAPLVAAALLLLESGAAGDALEFPAAAQIVAAPYLPAAAVERWGRARLDLRLRRDGVFQPGLRGLEAAAQPTSPRLGAALARLRGHIQSLPRLQPYAAWADALRQTLDAAGWPGDQALEAREQQALYAWQTTLAEVARLEQIHPRPVSLSTVLSRLRSTLAASTFALDSDASAPIRIFDFNVSGLDCSHIAILGASDTHLPPAASPAPFLPMVLQREHGLPGASPVLARAHAARQLQNLLRSAPAVRLSYATGPEPGGEGLVAEPSPLLSGWEFAPSLAPSIPEAATVLERIADHQGPILNLTDANLRRFGSDLFTDQSACAFRAFARHRLRVADLDSVAPGLSAAIRGNLLHAVLLGIWRKLSNSEELRGLDASARRLLIEQCARAAVADEPALRRRPALARLETDRLIATGIAWLELESSRPPFVVVELEATRKLEWSGIPLTLRVDREDELADGRRVYLDYKSGDTKPAAWECPRPEAPQLPLYVVTADDPEAVAAVAFAQLLPGELEFRGWASEPGILPLGKAGLRDLALATATWRAELESLASDFIAGAAAVGPKDRAASCRYCRLDALCRVASIPSGDDSVISEAGK